MNNDTNSDKLTERRQLEQLGEQIAELSAHIDAAHARLLKMIAEFDRRHGWVEGGYSSCAHWLSQRVGLTATTAREKVRVARALTGLPDLTSALAKGQLSYSKVRELTRIATPQNEADLVVMARDGTAAHVQRIVRAYRRCEQAELDTAARQREGRYLSLRSDEDGMLVLEGRLPAEVGALLTRALELCERELFKQARRASAEAPEARQAPGGASAGQRRADALGRLTPHHLQHWAEGGPTDRANLTLLCNQHHWCVHEGGWEVCGRAPDGLTFFTPGGVELTAQPPPPPVLPDDPVAALWARHAAEGLEIDAETNRSTWQGEPWDLSWAVEGLLELRAGPEG